MSPVPPSDEDLNLVSVDADYLAELKAENERLREGLGRIAEHGYGTARAVARALLAEGEQESE
jgi:hypothetical protein